jgi:hypothetical protein
MHKGGLVRIAYLAGALSVTLASTLVRADTPADTQHQYAQFDNTDTVITDNFTGLAWERAPVALQSFTQAQTTCATAGARVPTLKELLTLVDESSNQIFDKAGLVQKDLDPSAFPTAPTNDAPVLPNDGTSDYWSRTPADFALPAVNGFAVNFSTGFVASHKVTETLYVRCVK